MDLSSYTVPNTHVIKKKGRIGSKDKLKKIMERNVIYIRFHSSLIDYDDFLCLV